MSETETGMQIRVCGGGGGRQYVVTDPSMPGCIGVGYDVPSACADFKRAALEWCDEMVRLGRGTVQ